ncbi:hypothetical protein AB0I81_54745 [Nonomuraea sp. NPDC050404]|uniref:hypothetical protein n=1 Tax=Nonomuraea sp. NPDC050404 TaxID=3155783 RepID=UPI0034080556
MRYILVGADGRPYPSAVPGTLGGHRRQRLYGRLDCPSALRAIARGGYVGDRVFFPDARIAVAAGYRPCAVCLPEDYRRWRATEPRQTEPNAEPKAGPRQAGPKADGARPERVAELELAKVVELVRAQGARTVVIGHGRDSGPAADAFARAWGEAAVLATVDWPETAASWLRQARRFVSGEPDAWVVAGSPRGWAGMSERLRRSTDWDPARTYGFAATAGAIALAPPGTLEGMRGADRDGNAWRLGRNVIFREE